MKMSLALACAAWLSPALGAARDPVLDWAKGFGPLGDGFLRRSERCDVRSDYGTVVDDSCLKDCEPATRQAAKAKVDGVIAETLSGVRACHERLPDLPYLSDVVSVLRRSVIVCVPKDRDATFKQGFGAYTLRRDLENSASERVRRAGEGLQVEEFAWDFPPVKARRMPASFGGEYFIFLPDSIESLTTASLPWRKTVLFHEPLHYTGANNLATHNQVEMVALDRSKPCELNQFDDRIIFMEAACGFSGSPDLLYRLRQCGLVRACRDPLMTVAPPQHQPQGRENQADQERQYGGYWREHPEATRLFCARVRDGLSGDAAGPRRFTWDLESLQRVTLARRYLLENAVGFSGEAPPAYLAAMPERSRMVIAYGAWLRKALKESCFSPPKAGAAGLEALANKIKEALTGALPALDPDALAHECPLWSGSDFYAHTRYLAAYHNLERGLQQASLEVLTRLESFVRTGQPALDGLEAEVSALYAGSCPDPGSRYLPALCERGESVLVQAVGEVRARLNDR